MSESRERPLTARQQRFVDEYCISLNATEAARKAGYSARTAEQQGPRLLGNVGVAEAIAKRKAEGTEKACLTQERVLTELAALAHSSITNYQLNDETGLLELAPGAPPDAMAAVSAVKYRTRTFYGRGDDEGQTTIEREVEFKLWDKPSMVKLAGRHVGAKGFFDKVEVTGKDGKPLLPATKDDALAALAALGMKDPPVVPTEAAEPEAKAG